MYDVIVIGGGTAGLTAALYILRAGKRVLILEGDHFGGQITYAPRVENYPGFSQISGNAFADQLLEQVLSLGAEIELEPVCSVTDEGKSKRVFAGKKEFTCKSVVIATGAKHRHLGLDGEETLAGNGVSYCAVCDGAFFKDKRVAVVGGGNSALESAAFLAAMCETVFLIHRRDTFRGESYAVERLKKLENVKMILNTVVTALEGTDQLVGLCIKNLKSGGEDQLPVDGLFVAAGQVPDNGCVANLVALNEDGYIIAGEDCKTSCPGVFAAGDCRRKSVRQLTTAVADGAVAGLAACAWAEKQ